MAIEKNGQMTYVDEAGNEYLLFPKTKAECVEGLTPEAVGAAPAGYGLGESVPPTITTFETTTPSGWYFLPADNSPTLAKGVVHISNSGNNCNIIDFWDENGLHLRRKLVDGWGYWEYVNPPMISGVEYRTTERYEGKAVYKKKVSVGTLPNATVKTFTNLISGYTGIIDFQLTGYSSGAILHPTDPYYFNTTYGGITLNATSDLSAYSGIAYLAYIKD